jgi:hypothetical protein
VRGVVRAHRSRTSDALWLAWLLDPRFDTGELANRWNPIEIDNLGKKELGAAHAYQGYGGYVKVTPLDEPADALFIEAHIVFHEPPAWFNTSNLLRSKMPLAIQENIRKFRRQLDRLETLRE